MLSYYSIVDRLCLSITSGFGLQTIQESSRPGNTLTDTQVDTFTQPGYSFGTSGRWWYLYHTRCVVHTSIYQQWLTLTAPITTAANDIHKMRLDVSSESSARQRIHMKNQALFSLKDKSKKIKCRLLQFWFEA